MLQGILLALPHGIILGGAYGAIALGLSIIFGVTRVINFAHGSMLMVSCFGYFLLYKNWGVDPYAGIVIVAPIMYTLGYFLQKFLIKPLFLREHTDVLEPTSVMLLTIGLDYALCNLFMMIFGSTFRTVNTAASQNYFEVGDAYFVTQWAKIIAFVAGFILAGALWFIVNKTELGNKIRAVSQNRVAASLCGVDVYKTYSIAFGLGVAAVGVAGACLTQFLFVQPLIGLTFGTKSFMIVVLGGLGSIPGALLGGLIFGIVETVGAQFITSTSASMLSFLLFIVALLIRPRGLLGKN
jgi:branched-chain amino acid transport system permease protein